MKNDDRLLGVFAKYWQPGAVKTRLGRQIGDEVASKLYHAFVRTLVLRLGTIDVRRQICFSPPERYEEFAMLADGDWTIEAQCDGDLGQRMENYFNHAFAQGIQRAVLIGSDAPNLPLTAITEAFDALAENDIVLGPSQDGGYYLIGLARRVPPLFDGIAWSSAAVLSQTIDCITEHHLSFVQLPPWYDIDEFDDLRRLYVDLLADRDPGLTSLLTSVREVMEREGNG